MISMIHRLGKAAPALAAGCMLTASVLAAPARAADCNALLDDFNRTVDAGEEAKAQSLVDKIATDAECGRFQVPAQRRLAALRLSAAHLLMARGRPVSDYDRLLKSAESPEVLWQASATMGEVRFGERRFTDAAQAYDRAIEVVKNESLTPTPPSKFEIDGLVERSSQSRLLAANGAGTGGGEKFVQTAQRFSATARSAVSTRARCAASSRGRCRSRSPSNIGRPASPASASRPRAN